MTLNIYKLFNKQKISTLDAGARVFNLLKKNIEENPTDAELVLDFKDVIVFSDVPFKTLIGKMKTGLNGNVRIKLINHNQFIDAAFKKAL